MNHIMNGVIIIPMIVINIILMIVGIVYGISVLTKVCFNRFALRLIVTHAMHKSQTMVQI